MADEGRMGGDALDPVVEGAIGAVANPDNWRGLTPAEKEQLQAELTQGMTKEERRTVDALVAKQQQRGSGRRG